MFISLFARAFRMMAVYIFGASGDTVIEKGGHLNMGVPGIMFIGALGGIIGEIAYANNVPAGMPLNGFLIIFVPLIFALLFGALAGFIYCFLTVTLKANQNVVGLALTTFGVGLARFTISGLTGIKGSRVSEAGLMLQNLFPGYKTAGGFGEMFLSGSFFTYFAIILAIAISIFMAKSKFGLNLRAVGENPASADAAGINVTKYRYLSTMIGSGIVALGGLTFVLDVEMGVYTATDPVDAFGWLALSIVILCAWRSWLTIPISLGIGMLRILPMASLGIPTDYMSLLNALPYVAGIIVLIISSAIGSKKMQPPAGLGKTYFREDR